MTEERMEEIKALVEAWEIPVGFEKNWISEEVEYVEELWEAKKPLTEKEKKGLRFLVVSGKLRTSDWPSLSEKEKDFITSENFRMVKP